LNQEEHDFMTQSSRTLAQTWGYPRYRRFVDRVRNAATAWFRSKAMPVNSKYSYILAEWRDWPKNIILAEVSKYIGDSCESQRTDSLNFPLHKYLHHGLSSQAMLFNLAGPLLVRGDLSPLRTVIERKGLEWPDGGTRAMFEYEDRNIFNEDSGQPTSIDLVIQDALGHPRIFIESKFVEQEFGGCSVFNGGDCDGQNPASNTRMCYLQHIGRKYWPLMQRYGIVNGHIKEDAMCILANHYQFFREAVFAFEHKGIFLLLYDERSPVFYSDGLNGPRGVMPFLVRLLPSELQRHVSYVSVQELIAEIESHVQHEWIGEFKTKYALESM
jgi:hypothetical protein